MGFTDDLVPPPGPGQSQVMLTRSRLGSMGVQHRGSPGLKQTGKFGSRRSEHFECPREILFGTGIRFIATLQLGQLSIEFGKPLMAKLSE